MSDEFFEAIVCLENTDAAASVEEWFAERRLQVLPMRAGLLVSGPATVFRALFGEFAASSAESIRLTIPTELAGRVSSITIPRHFPHSSTQQHAYP
jgi:hypothetical protein